jgi:hypothetical protein
VPPAANSAIRIGIIHFASAQPGGDALDPGVNRPGFGDDPEKTADDQDKQRHVDRPGLAGDRIVQPGDGRHQHGNQPCGCAATCA